ncbi:MULTISPECIES: flagellar export chaperone FliS [Pseudoalteromonas]|uniref:Flagellar protein FliS n=1 Tax=Pseudoalteromonas agarivorans DSM 14585 TaxID=1312369 RepID=A0ACA8DUD9_9GAMM|nr:MULTISPECIES: flagellar export chaperone FliS [Pseudoalteromonas]ATC81547.1 flagellar protein FliS [Pseudoalteromonas agarivorans DSM 14585]MCK8133056.1 flagellar export chaperone FliS [Pseudoalteromonas sp. 2CM28B]
MNLRVNTYQKAQKELSLTDADPHKVIQILMRELLTQVYQAKVFMGRSEIEAKNNSIKKAIGIIGGLKGGLNFEQGGEIASNLDSLYDYLVIRLSDANTQNSIEILDEINELFSPIKEAWDGISEEDKQKGFALIEKSGA